MNRITLWGFYTYDPELFKDIKLPDLIDKENLIDTIMMESGDLYPYYQHPVFLKKNINNWFNRMCENFTRMSEALEMEYNPIHNYNRFEEIEDVTLGDNTQKTKATSNATSTGNREDKVSAYDSVIYQPEANTDSKNTSVQSQDTDINDKRKDDYTHNGHLYGNIGVTTTQAMMKEELELRKYDLILEIAHEFEKRFIVQIY